MDSDTSSTLLRVYDSKDLSAKEMKEITARPRIDFTSILDRVHIPPF